MDTKSEMLSIADDESVYSYDSLPSYNAATEDDPPRSSVEKAHMHETDQPFDSSSELNRTDSDLPLVEGEYGFYYPTSWSRTLVVTVNTAVKSDSPSSSKASKIHRMPLFYFDTSFRVRKKADVLFHAMPRNDLPEMDVEHYAPLGRQGPVLGAAHLPWNSRNMRLTLGDRSTSADDAEDIDLLNPNMWSHEKFEFDFRGKKLEWRRTQDPKYGVKGNKFVRSFNRNCYLLLDVTSDEEEVIAVFIAHQGNIIRRRGGLKFIDEDRMIRDRGEQFRLLVFLSISSILEKARRRNDPRKGKRSLDKETLS